MASADVVVIGGGVIGLAAAWAMADAKLHVTLVDAGPLGGQSSRAAAGILGPLAESAADGPLTRLLWRSLTHYPDWIAALREASPANPEWEASGILQTVPAAERDALRSSLAWRRSYDPAVSWQEPAPGDAWGGAIWSPHEGQLYGPAYLEALSGAAQAVGVTVRLGEPVQALTTDGDRVTGVALPSGPIAAPKVLLAAGAWTSTLWGLPGAVFPIRGQVIGLEAQPRPFPYVLFGPGGYVAPKQNGLVIVGATEDLSDYDSRVTLRGILALGEKLAALAPPLLALPWSRAWAGLRPATPDGLPLIGPDPALEGLYIAAGHYRNGLLLSPVTALAVRDWALGRPPDAAIPWDAFRPDRPMGN